MLPCPPRLGKSAHKKLTQFTRRGGDVGGQSQGKIEGDRFWPPPYSLYRFYASPTCSPWAFLRAQKLSMVLPRSFRT